MITMTLKQKLLTLDITVLLLIAVFSILMNEWEKQEILVKYFIPIMLTVYYIGRHLPLKIVKKHLSKKTK